MIHLIVSGSNATVCGIARTEAKGDVSMVRTEVRCPACRRAKAPTVKQEPVKRWSPQALGITR